MPPKGPSPTSQSPGHLHESLPGKTFSRFISGRLQDHVGIVLMRIDVE